MLDFYGRGRHLILDVSVARHLSRSYVGRAARVPLHTATHRERVKLHAYKRVSEVHRVIPFILESSGALGSMATSFMAHCAQLRRDGLLQERAHASWSTRSFSPFWRQRISVVQHSTSGSGICVRAAEDVYISG